ncbi:MAG: aspartyl protease family protein [Myxococcota bacterium]
MGLVLMGRETNAALIGLELNGVRAKALLDTGAEMNVVQTWLLEEAGLELGGGDEVTITDSSKISRTASFASISVDFDQWGRVEQPAVVIPSVPMFAERRIGLIVNPLFLARMGFAVRLDLPDRTMSELGSLSPPSGVDLQTCVNSTQLASGMALQTSRHVTSVTVGGVATALQIDTGARTTVLAASSEAATAVAGLASTREEARGLFGREPVTTITESVDGCIPAP